MSPFGSDEGVVGSLQVSALTCGSHMWTMGGWMKRQISVSRCNAFLDLARKGETPPHQNRAMERRNEEGVKYALAILPKQGHMRFMACLSL